MDLLPPRVWVQRAKAFNYRYAAHQYNSHADDADKLLSMLYSVKAIVRFKVSDSVRVSKFKTIFEKGYTPNWTTEIFRIIKVQKINPVTYLLEDYHGKLVEEFYASCIASLIPTYI